MGVKATSTSTQYYSSAYIGGNLSFAGCEIDDQRQIAVDWETKKRIDLPNDAYIKGPENLEFSFALYKGFGIRGAISIDVNQIIDYIVELYSGED